MLNRFHWIEIGRVEDIPARGARTVRTPEGDVAVFRTADNEVFALRDRCPHAGGPLSQGIVHGRSVTCPLHAWVIDLATGEATGPDEGCTGSIPLRVEDGVIRLGMGSRHLERTAKTDGRAGGHDD